MPRSAKLRKKRVGKATYWVTEAGGECIYFGNVKELDFGQAKALFNAHVKSLSDGTKRSNGLSCLELMEKFLEWVEAHRSPKTFDQRRRDCERFANFKVQGKKIADIPATKIRGEDLEAWLKHCRVKDKSGPQTLLHRQTSIKHCWNWGATHPSPNSYLPPTFRPFVAVERIYVPRKVLTEENLMTDDEVAIVFKAAAVDLDELHRFGPSEPRQGNPYAGFADMLRGYYHTGARTGELAHAEVGDFLRRTKQVILGQHKTSRTQRHQYVRRITLNEGAVAVFDRHCTGKKRNDRIFTTSDGKPWKPRSLPARFKRLKEVARQLKYGTVRDHITIYDFRHLWISDALMAGNDIATVARMAGTSVAMIEKVYGHFRNEHLQEAQARVDALRNGRQPAIAQSS